MDAASRRWAQERRDGAAAASEATPWNVPIEAMRIGGVEVLPIRDALALWDEAATMRHCADVFRCRLAQADDAVMVSLRRGPSRRDRATALLSREPTGRWQVEQVTGFANEVAPRWALRAAWALRWVLARAAPA